MNVKGEDRPRADRDDTAVDPAVGPLIAQFATLSQMLSTPADEPGGVVDVVEVLRRAVDAALRMISGADVVSVTLRLDDGTFCTPAHTDPLTEALDEAQYEVGEGPCLTATATPGLGVVQRHDLAAGDGDGAAADEPGLWPSWSPRAVDLGVRAVLATGIFPAGDPPRFAALNCYSTTTHAFSPGDRDTALLLACFAGVALRHTKSRTDAEVRAAQLEEALASRDVIGQAKGILMERRGYDADEAFQVLRRTSQDLNVKLRDVATTLATRRGEL